MKQPRSLRIHHTVVRRIIYMISTCNKYLITKVYKGTGQHTYTFFFDTKHTQQPQVQPGTWATTFSNFSKVHRTCKTGGGVCRQERRRCTFSNKHPHISSSNLWKHQSCIGLEHHTALNTCRMVFSPPKHPVCLFATPVSFAGVVSLIFFFLFCRLVFVPCV